MKSSSYTLIIPTSSDLIDNNNLTGNSKAEIAVRAQVPTSLVLEAGFSNFGSRNTGSFKFRSRYKCRF